MLLLFVNPRLLCSNIYYLPTPPPLENAYIIYSLFGVLIYIVQLETCNRCESHPKGKKKATYMRVVWFLQSHTVLCLWRYNQCFAIGMCSPPPQTSNIANPHQTACPRQLNLSSLLSFYCSTNQNMWPHRKSSQKPVDELYVAFKLAHPHVGPGTQMATSQAPTLSTVSATGALSDPIMDHRCVDVFLYFGPFNWIFAKLLPFKFFWERVVQRASVPIWMLRLNISIFWADTLAIMMSSKIRIKLPGMRVIPGDLLLRSWTALRSAFPHLSIIHLATIHQLLEEIPPTTIRPETYTPRAWDSI